MTLFFSFAVSFCIGIILSLVLIHYLYKYKMWKKKAGKIAPDGYNVSIFAEMHRFKEVGTPRMGGIAIWGSAIITLLVFSFLTVYFPYFSEEYNLLIHPETLILIFALISGAIIGLIDDWLEINGTGGHIAGGLSLKKRVVAVCIIALLCSLFFTHLGIHSVNFLAWDIALGAFFIPFFIIVILTMYSGGVIDGIDGLAGGIFAIMFASYGGIALYYNEVGIAVFCFSIVGSTLAFLFFNIAPAKFYMSETGSMPLTILLGIIAFLLDTRSGGQGIVALPFIAFPLLASSATVIIQIFSRRFRKGKNVFRIAPFHHHLEALSWPIDKIVIGYWFVSFIFALAGVCIVLYGIYL